MILPYLSIIGPGYTPFGGLGKYRRGRGYACGVHRRGRSGVTYYQQQEWFSKKGFSLRSLPRLGGFSAILP